MQFEWDPNKAELNFRRHQVSFEEAMEAFFDVNAVDEFDKKHSFDEDRYNLIGLSSRRLLFVVYAEYSLEEEVVIRIISARKTEGKYRRLYEQR